MIMIGNDHIKIMIYNQACWGNPRLRLYFSFCWCFFSRESLSFKSTFWPSYRIVDLFSKSGDDPGILFFPVSLNFPFSGFCWSLFILESWTVRYGCSRYSLEEDCSFCLLEKTREVLEGWWSADALFCREGFWLGLIFSLVSVMRSDRVFLLMDWGCSLIWNGLLWCLRLLMFE